MGTPTLTLQKKALTPERRFNWRWYPWRTYWHVGLHRCITPRQDGCNRFLWLAAGPIDLRVQFKGAAL